MVSIRFKTQVVWYALLIMEMMFLLRFFMKLMGADVHAYFSMFVYGITGIFIFPLRAVVPSFEFGNIVFEPTTILAIIVYWMIAIGIVKLIQLLRFDENIECREIGSADQVTQVAQE